MKLCLDFRVAFLALCFIVNMSWGILPERSGLNMGSFPYSQLYPQAQNEVGIWQLCTYHVKFHDET